MTKYDKFGNKIFNEQELTDLIYSMPLSTLCDIKNLDHTNLDINLFNKYAKNFNLSLLPNTNSSNLELHDYDKLNQNNWFLPEEYRNFDIETYLLNRCKTNAETERVNNELYIYKQKDLLMLLKYIYYLISIMKRNQIVWGVGRGSSVASFILYLIGLNKINPLKYNLDFKEFLK